MQVLAVLAACMVGIDVTAGHLAAARLMMMNEEGRQGGGLANDDDLLVTISNKNQDMKADPPNPQQTGQREVY